MQPKHDETFERPGWNRGGIWMGADFFALMRILQHNRFRVPPSSLFDCMIDLLFALANTGLKGVQALILGSRVKQVQLEHDPLFIIGHWRTGTTMLHELLALDPRHRYPTTYECFVPNHFLLSERWLKSWTGFLLPPHRPPDNMTMGWDLPQEDEFALCNMGIPSPYVTITFPNHPPQYQQYLDLERLSPAELRRWKHGLLQFLRQLHYKQPGRIILKSPQHTFRLPVLHDMFPNARFVHMVRDPLVVYTSTIRLWKSLYATHGYQKPNYHGLEEYVFDIFCRMHERLEATRGLIAPNRFHDVRYEDLVSDTVGEMKRLYQQLDLGQFQEVEPAIREYVAQHADYKTNRYELSPQREREIRARWKPYFDKYGYTQSPPATRIGADPASSEQ